jgi:hypothetical protein
MGRDESDDDDDDDDDKGPNVKVEKAYLSFFLFNPFFTCDALRLFFFFLSRVLVLLEHTYTEYYRLLHLALLTHKCYKVKKYCQVLPIRKSSYQVGMCFADVASCT